MVLAVPNMNLTIDLMVLELGLAPLLTSTSTSTLASLLGPLGSGVLGLLGPFGSPLPPYLGLVPLLGFLSSAH